ncbi:MFS transporter [Embleya sp. NPDC055664]
MFKRLAPLALATFAVGTDSYVIAGLLPSIADDLDVSTPAAGQLVTVFALVLAVSAPVMAAVAGALDRRTALLVALGVFVVGNALTAVGTGYEVVMAARVLTAIGAGTITSTASGTAAAIVEPERRGRALAFVLGGLTLATAVGLPLGTLIGRTDWRITLWAVAALGLLAAVGVALGLPKVVLPAASLADRLRPLRQRRVLSLLAITAMTFLASYTLYTYIAPALDDATNGSDARLTLILTAWGTGTLAGNLTAGRLVDRRDPTRVLTVALASATVALALTPVAVHALASAMVWAMIWGGSVGIIVVPQQHRLIALHPTAAPILLGLNSCAIYTGIALGGALGGLAQQWPSLTPPQLGYVAAAITAITLLHHIAAIRRAQAQTQVPAPATPPQDKHPSTI